MAIDSNANPANPETTTVSAIENEFPTYRAISPAAVVSLVFGLLSIFCFTHWFFLLFAAAAIALGVHADRKIQRLPDILTGRGLAQAGIGLGLVFGLASITTAAVQDFALRSSARRFGQVYRGSLKQRSIEPALWYYQPPSYRKDKSPEEVAQAMRKSESKMFEMEIAELRALNTRLTGIPAGSIEFSGVESYGSEGINAFATILYDVKGPADKDHAAKESALVVARGEPKGRGRYDWTVERVKYPYRPDSYQPEPKPVDDGHGHGGGGHAH